jgi:hypothetical protein
MDYPGRESQKEPAVASITVSPEASTQPRTLSISATLGWMVTMVVAGLLAYYFVGVDQGAISVFGQDTHIHEFVHDARHLLGFPCH